MAYLQYYRDEALRQPIAHQTRCTTTEAQVAIRKLARHFKVGDIRVKFTSGRNVSYGGSGRIVLNQDHLNWLLVAHEFAHVWDILRENRKHDANVAAWYKDPNRQTVPFPHRRKFRYHTKKHARFTDRAIAYMEKKGWIQGAIKTKVEEVEKRQEERAAVAAQPPSSDERIAHKEKLIANLERKQKRLATLIKKHRRSIAALKRHQAKEQS